MTRRKTTWKALIQKAMEPYGETWADVVGAESGPNARARDNYECDPEEPLHTTGFDGEFDPGYGGVEGDSFTVWTKDRVYFPVKYDGAEWVASVPRRPCKEVTDHVGGG